MKVSVTGVVDNTQEVRFGRNPRTHVHVPLNLARLTAGQLRSLGGALDLPMSGSVDDLCLIIEGKIMDLGCDPRNIQVALSKDKDDRGFTLSDHEGVFLTVNPESEEEHEDDSEGTRDHEPLRSLEPTDEANELEVMREMNCE